MSMFTEKNVTAIFFFNSEPGKPQLPTYINYESKLDQLN